ncbi:MAG TPA: phage/plasmid primase, P4 family [Spirochaetia bacterium]|nr:phage/plasmid primase, P4 family [Spirochaetia bacterium]
MDAQEREARYRRVDRLTRGLCQNTDTSNAERMLRKHGKDIRYCTLWKKWLCWDGVRWEIDTSAKMQALAKEVIRDMYVEASRLGDDRDRRELENHARKTEAVRGRKAMLEALSWEPPVCVHPEQLDANDWLFNCRNGTIDLKTGELRAPDRQDLMTKAANAEYVPGAECPRWKGFLREITGGNEELIAFIAKAAGWALTGNTSEQAMFILHGNGANGKSTFLNVLLDLFGDYAIATPTETFMRRTGGPVSNDLAALRGARLVTTIEADEGKRLSESLIKQITGNDRLTVLFLYSEFFSFEPTCKIFMATNHKPIINGTDHAVWRRIRLIPFTVTIPPERQDADLAECLKEEYPGMLNWLIDGCLRWQAERLGIPPAVREATESYRSEMDVIGNFLRDRCVVDPRETVQSRELFKAYAVWCEGNNEKAGSERLLALRLQEMGYEKQKRADARYWLGIGLQDEEPR